MQTSVHIRLYTSLGAHTCAPKMACTSAHTSTHTSLGAQTSTHTSLGAYTRSPISFGAHTSAQTSLGANTISLYALYTRV